MDICKSGARLQGEGLPRAGANLLLKMGEIDVLATVLWQNGEQCGLRLDEPISPESIEQIQAEANCGLPGNLTPDERIAVAHLAKVAPPAP